MYKPHSLAIVLVCLFLSTYFLVACRREPNLTPTTPSQPDTTQTNTDTTRFPPSDTTLQSHDTTVQPVDTSNYSVDNTWECDIDGIHYSGMVDTSFTELTHVYETHADTMITCTGTSDDKKANIEFRIRLNRYPQYSGDYSGFEGVVLFDTLSGGYFTSDNGPLRDRMRFTLDTLASNKLKASFNGVLNSTHNLTNGHFSCTFGKGNKEPKFFSFLSNDGAITGIFRDARLTWNSLILEGSPFYQPELRFKLVVRTGGTIKPGTYEGRNGDVGMSFFIPSIYRFYITDAPGNTTVVIHSVSGSVVRGTFSAVDDLGRIIQQGKFACRVKDYIPETDLANKWQFNLDDGPYGTFGFRAFGGNANNAALTQDGSKYVLTINGTSDHGTSSFKIRLHSYAPITSGVYQTAVSGGTLDELYYKSPIKIWNGNEIYMHVSDSYPAFCRIDAIDASHVEGVFYGTMGLFTSDASSGGGPLMQYGKFRASF